MRFLQSMCLSSFRAPIGWGDPERRGPLSRQARLFFGGSGADCLCSAKGEAGNPGGKPKPVRAGTAERRRRARELPCSQAQPRRAERQTCLQKMAELLKIFRHDDDGRSLPQAVPHRRMSDQLETRVRAPRDSQNVVTIELRAGSERDVCYSDRQLRAARQWDSPASVYVGSASVSGDDGVPRESKVTSGRFGTARCTENASVRGMAFRN